MAHPSRVLEANHQPDFAEPGETHSQRQGPVRFVPHRHGAVGGGRDEWHQIFHGNMRPLQMDGFACRILEDKAVGLQIPILLQQADPIFFPVTRHGHELFSEIPTVEEEHTKRDCVLNRRFQQGNTHIDL